MKTHKDLDAWNFSIELATEIYKITEKFPHSEMYGLSSQMRRAAVSIPSNIAEGAARQSKKEFIQFLYIALGSCAELETQVILSERLNYLSDIHNVNVYERIQSVGKMVNGLIKYLKGSD